MKMNIEPFTDYGFADKWGNRVALHYFTQVPNILIRCQGHLNLTDKEVVVLIQLASHWYQRKSLIYPSIKTLATYSGKNPTSVQRAISQLKKKGYLHSDRRMMNSNLYDLSPCTLKLKAHAEQCDRMKQNRPDRIANSLLAAMANLPDKEYELENIPLNNTSYRSDLSLDKVS